MEKCIQGFASLLVQLKLLSAEEACSYQVAAQKSSQRLILYLARNEIINADDIAQCLARYFNLSYIDLDSIDVDIEARDIVSNKLIIKYNVLPLYCRGNQLHLAMDDPSQHVAIQDIKFQTGYSLVLLVAQSLKLSERITQLIYQKENMGLEQCFTHLPKIAMGEIESLNQDLEHSDAPIIKLVNIIIQQAITKSVSDIHFEPYDSYYRIRYRQDGLLYDTARPPPQFANRICARIKVMACLNISERKISQDGRFTFNTISNKQIDCRVSICPTISGEKIVIRILNSGLSNKPQIDLLFMTQRDKNCLLKSLSEPQGLILVTGPTGSGKSHTLYASLNYLNTGITNISTVEDPVEIKLPGINQVQVNPKFGLDFASTLRTFMRQDPDVIMVGEIRDFETAEIAIKASQTGHLVLSTLHTNSSAETLIRLLNLGIPAFYLTNTIKLIIAQRLIRKLCENCKIISDDVNLDILNALGYKKTVTPELKFYKAIGCKNCIQGYKGRIAIFEVMPMSSQISKIMMDAENDVSMIVNQAILEGMDTIKQAGFRYAENGVTSLEELVRVT
ncbi:MAG: ATPase, T2SS/T4P/T4SS family [Legionellaceae bacterium]|nr:ATPase, T2SS/T4P/T4SS family [Legionellaceae bacterium]